MMMMNCRIVKIEVNDSPEQPIYRWIQESNPAQDLRRILEEMDERSFNNLLEVIREQKQRREQQEEL